MGRGSTRKTNEILKLQKRNKFLRKEGENILAKVEPPLLDEQGLN